MGFVVEYMSAADMEKYKIKEIDELVEISWRTYSDQWAVDRGRGIYLRRIAKGKDELSRKSAWSFYWNENLLWVSTEQVDGGSNGRETPGWERRRVGLIRLMNDRSKPLPLYLAKRFDEVLMDLEAAFLVYKDSGVYSAITDYKLCLEASEGALA